MIKVQNELIQTPKYYPKQKSNNQRDTLVLLESGDEVLNYIETAKYFKGSNIDITYGGSHTYEYITHKLEKIVKFLDI